MIVYSSLGVANAILLEAGMSFLGVGVQPPTPSWGNMLNVARNISVLEGVSVALDAGRRRDRPHRARRQLHRRRPARRPRPPDEGLIRPLGFFGRAVRGIDLPGHPARPGLKIPGYADKTPPGLSSGAVMPTAIS